MLPDIVKMCLLMGKNKEYKIQFEIGSLIKNVYYSLLNNKIYPSKKDYHDYITELTNQNNITNHNNEVINDYNVLTVINQKK